MKRVIRATVKSIEIEDNKAELILKLFHVTENDGTVPCASEYKNISIRGYDFLTNRDVLYLTKVKDHLVITRYESNSRSRLQVLNKTLNRYVEFAYIDL